MDGRALHRAAGGHSFGAAPICGLVGQALSQSVLRPRGVGGRLLSAGAERDTASVAHRERVLKFYHPDRIALRGFRRHSYQSQGRGHTPGQRHFSGRGRADGQRARYHRRFDALDPSVAARQQIPRHRASRGFLHFHRVQCRGLPHSRGRPAAVPGLFERRAVLVGGAARLADLADRRGDFAGDVLRG